MCGIEDIALVKYWILKSSVESCKTRFVCDWLIFTIMLSFQIDCHFDKITKKVVCVKSVTAVTPLNFLL